MAGNPALALRDDLSMHQLIFLDPCNVTAEEAVQVSDRIRSICSEALAKGDGFMRDWRTEKAARGLADTPWIGGESA